MLLRFAKMNGAGNDFVVIDNRSLALSLTRNQIARLCDRHRGVGADGLLAVEPAAHPDADFRFRYYNADGGEAEMCGNGARCFARFAARLLPTAPCRLRFETLAGPLAADLVADQVRLAMPTPSDLRLHTPTRIDGLDAQLHFLNTGVPHAVAFVPDLAALDVPTLGRSIRHHPDFAPAGTNANFAQVLAPDHIALRTYERGVEAETLACGTGITAAALIHHLLHSAPSPVHVHTRGGDLLTVDFTPPPGPPRPPGPARSFPHVSLTGPADFVFNGQIDL